MKLFGQFALSLLLDESQLANLQIELSLPILQLSLSFSDLLQVVDQTLILLPVGDDIALRLLLDPLGWALQNFDSFVHVLQLPIKLLDGLRVLSLLVDDLISVVLDVILVDVHQVFDTLVLVLILVCFVHGIYKFINELFLFTGAVLLLFELSLELLNFSDFRLLVFFHIGESLSLIFETFLKLQ